jgi:hypothetical protein
MKHLCWVPHSLTATQKAKRGTLSNALLRWFRSICHHGEQFSITPDDFWFYFPSGHRYIRGSITLCGGPPSRI